MIEKPGDHAPNYQRRPLERLDWSGPHNELADADPIFGAMLERVTHTAEVAFREPSHGNDRAFRDATEAARKYASWLEPDVDK